MNTPRNSAWSLRSAATVLATAGFLVAGRAAGEPLTLSRAVELARGANPTILESRANAEAARQGHREAWVARLPGVEVRQVALKTDSPADAFGLQLMQERFSFPAFTMSDPNEPDPIVNYATEVQATLPLFTGGKLEAGIAQAGRMETAAAAVRDHTESAVSLGVADGYMGVLLAERFLELAEKALDTTTKHVDQAQAFYDAGMMVESDLLQARTQRSRMEENRIVAQNNARLARAGLNRAMGVDQARVFELDANLPEPSSPFATFEDALASAHERRRDLQAIGAKVEAASLGVRMAWGDYLPEIALVGKYSLNDEKIFGDHGTSYALMAMARWKVWNWGQTSFHLARSKSERDAAMESARAYEQQVDFEVRESWQAVEEARARILAAASGVTTAEKALAILEERFGQGVAKMTDILDAETMVNEARARELQARFGLQRSLRALNFAAGLPPVAEDE
jgi:outer membrane protein TolC